MSPAVGLPFTSPARGEEKEAKRSQTLLGITVLSLGPAFQMLPPHACCPASPALSSELNSPFQTKRLVTA